MATETPVIVISIPQSNEIFGIRIEAFPGYAVGHDPQLWARFVDAGVGELIGPETTEPSHRVTLTASETPVGEAYAGAIPRRVL